MRNLQELLDLFPEGKWKGNTYVTRCPICGDRHQHNHLNITPTGNTVMIHCMIPECGANGKAVMDALGKPVSFLFMDETRPAAQTTSKARPAKKKPKVFPQIPEKYYLDKNTKTEQMYPYILAGDLVSYKVKYRNPDTKEKYFQWWTPTDGGFVAGTMGKKIPLYNVDALAAADPTATVYIPEGEKDVCTMADMSLTAVCTPNGGGQTVWHQDYTEALRGRNVVVITDNDDVGEKYGKTILENLRGAAASIRVIQSAAIYKEIGEKGDITDIVERIGKDNTVGALQDAEDKTDPAPQQKTETAILTSFADIAYEEPKFIMPPYFPIGKLSIVQGDPSVGKTAFMCAIAAKVSTGTPLLDTPCDQGNVIIVSVEDDPGVLKGRIEASGGDSQCCYFIENPATKGITFNSPEIEKAIKKVKAKMILFDPLQSFLGAVDMNKANETRPVLAALAEMAKRNECAVVIISHQAKGQTKAIYKALGSVDIVAASRSMIQIGANPDNPDQRVAVHVKSSNAKAGQSIIYEIGDRGGVSWIEYTDMTTDDLDRAQKRKETGIPYDDEIVVAIARAVIAENPEGTFLTFNAFQQFGQEVLNVYPGYSNRDLGKKVRQLRNEMIRKDCIEIDTDKLRPRQYVRHGLRIDPENPNAAPGISIRKYHTAKEFQTSVPGGI